MQHCRPLPPPSPPPPPQVRDDSGDTPRDLLLRQQPTPSPTPSPVSQLDLWTAVDRLAALPAEQWGARAMQVRGGGHGRCRWGGHGGHGPG